MEKVKIYLSLMILFGCLFLSSLILGTFVYDGSTTTETTCYDNYNNVINGVTCTQEVHSDEYAVLEMIWLTSLIIVGMCTIIFRLENIKI